MARGRRVAALKPPVFYLRGRGSWDSRSPGKAQVRGAGPQGTEPGAWPCLGAGARKKAESGSRTLQRHRPHPASGPDLQDRKRPRWRCSWQPATAAGNEPLGCVRARCTPGGVAATRSSAGGGATPALATASQLNGTALEASVGLHQEGHANILVAPRADTCVLNYFRKKKKKRKNIHTRGLRHVNSGL